MKKTYRGSCHCGKIRFEVDADPATQEQLSRYLDRERALSEAMRYFGTGNHKGKVVITLE